MTNEAMPDEYSNNYLISPQSRKGRKDNFSFHLPLRGPAEAGCKQRQMKNNQPPADYTQANYNYKIYT